MTTGARREVLATLAIVGFFVVLAVGRPIVRRLARHPTPERCAAMLARYAEQESRSRNRVPVEVPVSLASLASPDVASCTASLTDAEVECALHAGYVDELERCLP